MITTGASPLDISFSVLVDGIALDKVSIQMVSIELQENMHNLAVLHVAGIPPDLLTYYMDMPIAMNIKVGNVSNHSFTGYISYLEPVSVNKHGLVNKSPFQMTKIYCMGTTYVMRNKKTRAWTRRTLPQIAAELAREYNLSISVPNNPFIFPRIAQNGKSDWQVLVEAADYLGYRVMSRGTHIDIWDPFALLSRNGGTVPIYAMSGNQGDLRSSPGQVIEFKAYVGSITPFGDVIPDSINVLDGNQIVTVNKKIESGYGKSIERPFTYTAAENVASVGHGEEFLTGTKHLPIVATATIVGAPSIEPGVLVNLYKYGSGIDGLWIVSSAKHELFRGSAMSYLTIKRDTTYEPFSIQEKFSASPKVNIDAPILRNKKWINSKEVINVYS